MYRVLQTVVTLLCLTQFVQCYNILGLFPLQSRSHFVMFERLMIGLAEKGHEVDVVSHFPQKQEIPRYNDLSVKDSLPIFVNNLTLSMVGQNDQLFMLNFITSCGLDNCAALFKTPVLKELKNTKKKYDLLITEVFAADCMLGFGWLFDIPTVALTSSVNLPWGSDRFGNPDNPSYIPNYFTPFTSKMTLYQRLVNTLLLVYSKIFYELYYTRPANELSKNFFGDNLPDLHQLEKNTSLLLVNSHFSLNQARPIVPNFVEVAGLHIKDLKPLPENIEKLLQTDTKGIIYLSMGSMLLTESFDDPILQGLFDAFAELPYKVLWKATREKFSKNLTIPNNIHFEPWLPQLEILCHPNIKLFVSHGGLMGTQEAIYCGVPRIGIPIFADQELNIENSERMGLAIKVAYDRITKDTVLSAARKLLEDRRYKENAERVSKSFRDRPQTPLETAIYWVEYVIRHRGAPELRSAGADLSWYQYHLVDVGVVLLCGITSIIILVYYIVKTVYQVFLKNRNFKNKKKMN